MSELDRYSNEFLNMLAYHCENEKTVIIRLKEGTLLYGKIEAMTADYVELFTEKRIYMIPIANILYYSISKEEAQ